MRDVGAWDAPTMRLKHDPNAEIIVTAGDTAGQEFEALLFTCPKDGCTILARFVRGREAFHFSPTVFIWSAFGTFPDTLELTPSIHAMEGPPAALRTHWHGWIKNGETRE